MLEIFPEMKLIPCEPKIGNFDWFFFENYKFINDFLGGDALEGFGFTLEQRKMMQRFHPDHKLDSIGI